MIIVLIVLATLPLWRSARLEVRAQFAASRVLSEGAAGKIVALGCEEQRTLGYLLDDAGIFHFFTLQDGREYSRAAIPNLSPARITSVWQSPDGGKVAVGASDGRALIGAINYSPQYDGAKYVFSPAIDISETLMLDSLGQAIRFITRGGDRDGRMVVAGITRDDRVVSYSQRPRQGSNGSSERIIVRQHLPRLDARPLQLAVNPSLDDFFVGADNGSLYHFIFGDADNLALNDILPASDHQVTTLGFLVGGRSLVVGDGAGNTSVYFSVPDAETKLGRRFRRIHELPALDGAVMVQRATARNRTYLAVAATGEVGLFFPTNERVLFQDRLTPAPIAAAIFSPRADGLLLMDDAQRIYDVTFENPHPEANARAFFQKIWYEGYERPAYVWQSSGPDGFEAKLSLIPLIFGTLKGTFSAMLIALPIALGAALYVSQFMHPRLRGMFKPVVEMMATLPSVVLGFLAALWFAPLLEKILPAALLMILAVPLIILFIAILWKIAGGFVPRLRLARGKETLVILPAILAGMWFCLKLNGVIETNFFGGDCKQWLIETAGIAYDQRNAFAVGVAMAFAVIPVVFALAEEALSTVPARLTAASLALGATPWQTALRIILPTASPGMLAATMLGFGRAIGETMIVLMATGNTPIMDINLLEGFRALSANIAVEMPESPVGGTLFRTLFLSALLLFVMTFLTNTIAELVRQHQREKYGRI